MTGDLPRRLVVDAGPLIALSHIPDPYHAIAVAGFEELIRGRTTVLAPLPIAFEVYKWLAYEASLRTARRGLAHIRRAFEITYPDEALLSRVTAVLESMPAWGGSLEDALVAVSGLWLDVPVWTLNYRDLGAFRNLHFWTPRGA